ncbi:M20 family metallopeptidase [Salibacterium sp. K-3]
MDPVTFLQKLVALDTTNPPGNENKIAEVLEHAASEAGLAWYRVPLESGRSNLIIEWGTGEEVDLLLSAHMDTVQTGSLDGWRYDPFGGEIEDGRMFGRGTTDMKSGLAAMYLALQQVKEEIGRTDKKIVLALTAGEEVDCIGAKKLQEDLDFSKVKQVLIAEPTDNELALGHKGALFVKLTSYGKTAHGSMPEHGINAIENLQACLNACKTTLEQEAVEHPVLGTSTYSLNQIAGGTQANVVPDYSEAVLDIRTVPPQHHHELVEQLQRVTETLPGMSLEVILDRASVFTDEKDPFVSRLRACTGIAETRTVSYYTDGSVFNAASDIPMVILGPGTVSQAHQPDEFVYVQAYLEAVDYYKMILKDIIES